MVLIYRASITLFSCSANRSLADTFSSSAFFFSNLSRWVTTILLSADKFLFFCLTSVFYALYALLSWLRSMMIFSCFSQSSVLSFSSALRLAMVSTRLSIFASFCSIFSLRAAISRLSFFFSSSHLIVYFSYSISMNLVLSYRQCRRFWQLVRNCLISFPFFYASSLACFSSFATLSASYFAYSWAICSAYFYICFIL